MRGFQVIEKANQWLVGDSELDGISMNEKKRERLFGTEIPSRRLPPRTRVDPTKALVIKYFEWLVACGLADWDACENGDMHLRFHTGETFRLAETCVVRLT